MANNLPKHRRVYAALRHEILLGKYDAREKFPSEAMLMRRFNVSRITVRQAMTDLKNEGFLEARSGSGTYLSALARHATGMIGLVIPDYSSNEFFRRLGDELVRAGKSAGYTMLLGELPGRTPAARAHEAISLAREYARRKVVGVIIEPVELIPNCHDLTFEIIAAFDELHIPLLLVDRDITPHGRSKYDLVGISNLAAGFAIGRALIEGGAKRIAFLMPPNSASANLQRMLGVAGAVIESGAGWTNQNILCVNPDNRTAVKRALRSKYAPDAIVCHNDQTAAKLPCTVKVAGFDGLAVAGRRKFPSMRQPIDQLADTAIATLLERIRNPRLPPRQVLLAAERIG